MFKDRYAAGQRLATPLLWLRTAPVVVYGLARGGVLVAYEVAKILQKPLDVLIVRKIGCPTNSECAMCAVSEQGELICEKESLDSAEKAWVSNAFASAWQEAHRMHVVYKHERPLMTPQGKVAIIIDDGMATGLTMEAAIHSLRRLAPAAIIVATPVASRESLERVARLADRVVVMRSPTSFNAVGDYYADFSQVTDSDVTECLSSARFLFHTVDTKRGCVFHFLADDEQPERPSTSDLCENCKR